MQNFAITRNTIGLLHSPILSILTVHHYSDGHVASHAALRREPESGETQIDGDEREDCRDMGVTKEEVEIALNSSLNPSHLVVVDTSGGCGASFEVTIVSEHFEGKRLLERHRLVNTALAEQMKQIHALSIKKAVTPAQWNPNPTASQQ